MYNIETDEPLLTESSIAHIIKIIEEYGSDVWWEMDENELIAPDYRNNGKQNFCFFSFFFGRFINYTLHCMTGGKYRRGMDTMDVWFDSGVSWKFISEKYNR